MVRGLRATGQVLADFTAWLLAVPIAMWLRFDFTSPLDGWGNALLWGAAAGATHVIVGYARQLYRGRYRFGSFDEVSGVVFSVAMVTVAWEIAVLVVQPQDLPRTIPLIAGGLALAAQLAGRFSLRFYRERVRKARTGESLTHCAECEEEIPEARRLASPGVKLCLDCQQERDARFVARGGINRRGSKDSQLK